MEQVNKDCAPMTVDDFLKAAKCKASYKVALDWSTVVKDAKRRTPVEMNAFLLDLHATDDAFRSSVRETVSKDSKYARRHQDSVVGQCQAGQCRAKGSKPSVQLFSGQHEVSFVETDGGFSYRVEGGRKNYTPIEVVPCDSTDAPRQCRVTGDSEVHVLTENRITKSTPIAQYYRLNFSDDGREYLLENTVTATGGDEASMRQKCAAALCDVNASVCPAPFCRRDGDRCAPNPDLVHAVHLA